MNNDYYQYPPMGGAPRPPKRARLSTGVWICILCVVIAATMLLTYTLTAAHERNAYQQKLAEQQAVIESLQTTLEEGGGTTFQKLEYLSMLFEEYAYYSDSLDQAAILDAVLHAYAEATGDLYAEYYTEEEFAALMVDSSGNSVGVGISVVNNTLSVAGSQRLVFEIIKIYKNAPAAGSDLRVGDCIGGVKVDGAWKSIDELGGYDAGLNAVRGESGTDVELLVYRSNGDTIEQLEFCITRASFVKESVSYRLAESDAKVGIVSLEEFDMTTPHQFRDAVKALLAMGAEHFVFDVRNNPGGDLMSIKAVLSYILEEGDLILSAIDSDGTRATSYYAEPQTLTGDYAPCSVAKEEVGMFRDLDMVVLCNGNTASAAEVFTASLRDHKQIPIIGETTYGKGIMQSFISLSTASLGTYDGWLKLTTYAYVTECGVPYHGIGIKPDPNLSVSLGEEAADYSIYTLPESLDAQLLAAIARVKQ